MINTNRVLKHTERALRKKMRRRKKHEINSNNHRKTWNGERSLAD